MSGVGSTEPLRSGGTGSAGAGAGISVQVRLLLAIASLACGGAAIVLVALYAEQVL